MPSYEKNETEQKKSEAAEQLNRFYSNSQQHKMEGLRMPPFLSGKDSVNRSENRANSNTKNEKSSSGAARNATSKNGEPFNQRDLKNAGSKSQKSNNRGGSSNTENGNSKNNMDNKGNIDNKNSIGNKHSDKSENSKSDNLFSGLNVLKMLNFKNMEIDSDRMIIIAICLLLSKEDVDEMLLLALIYIMI